MQSVNETLNPLHRLILSYAKRDDQEKYEFLFAFDSRLAEVIRSTSEPLIGQIRLTWWRDILTMPAGDRPEGEPLVTKFNDLEQDGLSGTALLKIIDGWEAMLDDFPWENLQFEKYAIGRGTGYFSFGLEQPELSDEITDIAKLWALWDFATHCSDSAMRDATIDRCKTLLDNISAPHFDRNGRPLSILCKLAMRDVKSGALSETLYRPSTAARIIWHGITGM